jgi:hypothetical protein
VEASSRGSDAGHPGREPDGDRPDLRPDAVRRARDGDRPGREPDAGHPDGVHPGPDAARDARPGPRSTGCYRRAAASGRASDLRGPQERPEPRSRRVPQALPEPRVRGPAGLPGPVPRVRPDAVPAAGRREPGSARPGPRVRPAEPELPVRVPPASGRGAGHRASPRWATGSWALLPRHPPTVRRGMTP